MMKNTVAHGRMKINLHTQKKKTTNEDYVFLSRSRSMSIHRFLLPPLVYITIFFHSIIHPWRLERTREKSYYSEGREILRFFFFIMRFCIS